MGFYIEMIAVGYGDSFLLTLDDDDGSERYVLIDGGPASGAAAVVEHVKQYAPRGLDLVIGTHLDNDHIGGLGEVLESVPVGGLVLNTPGTMAQWLAARARLKSITQVASVREMMEGVKTADDLVKVAARRQIPVERALQGKYWSVGSTIRLDVLNPTEDRLSKAWAEEVLAKALQPVMEASAASEPAPATTASNNASIVLSLRHNGAPYALMTGDAGADVIREVTARSAFPFLKVPHHGSNTGLDQELVAQLSPKTAYIPVGPNSYGHPAKEVTELLRQAGARIYCSEKVSPCYGKCGRDWGSVICLPGGGKPGRPNWSSLDASKCPANG